MYKPLPLNWIAGAENAFFSLPPQWGQTFSGAVVHALDDFGLLLQEPHTYS